MIATQRLWLRRPTDVDLRVIKDLWRDHKVRQFLGGTVSEEIIQQKTAELQKHWELHQFGQCVVFDKVTQEIIGLCGLHHSEEGIELSYMFFSKYWKKGLASEAVSACLDYGFRILKFNKIIAITQVANIPSCQLLQKMGMTPIKSFERYNALQCLFVLEKEQKSILIDRLKAKDLETLTKAFHSIGWNKPVSLFEKYLEEAEAGERLVWVAYVCDRAAGYITLKWQSQYPLFKDQNIPEIMDLNVLSHMRKIGVGSKLLDVAETEAATKANTVGIGVGLYAGDDGGYGSAQKLYVKRGYIPDGKGVTYNYQPTTPGSSYPLDDNLVLWFIKKLKY